MGANIPRILLVLLVAVLLATAMVSSAQALQLQITQCSSKPPDPGGPSPQAMCLHCFYIVYPFCFCFPAVCPSWYTCH